MADGHPIAAGVFLAVVASGFGSLVWFGVRGDQLHAAKAAKEAKAAQHRLIEGAVARGQNGDLEGAAAMLAEALRRDPADDDAAYNLGIALSALGRTADAEKVLSMLVARAPEDWAATAELAAVYDAKGEGDRALQLLEKIPVGQGDLAARMSSEEQWGSIRGHARFGAFLAKHGISVKTATTAGGG